MSSSQSVSAGGGQIFALSKKSDSPEKKTKGSEKGNTSPASQNGAGAQSSSNVDTLRTAVFIAIAIACLTRVFSPPLALAGGIALTLTLGQPFPKVVPKMSKDLLKWSVVGLGFGMNLAQVWAAGKTGFGFTVATIFGTLLVGLVIGRALKVDSQTSSLVSSGTAICGGSAIAAVGASINAHKKSMSVALGTVFILNAIALMIFPPIGRLLELSQEQFGLWAAIAIHDTSSVVGAAEKYGEKALEIATTVKLTRALWIVPVALAFAVLTRKKGAKVAIPWFIGFFVLAAAVRTVLPQGEEFYLIVKDLARRGLILTLFLIGTTLSREAITKVGPRVMVQGVILWAIISVAGLAAVWALVG